MNSTQVIKETIYFLNGHRECNSASTNAQITASVGNKRVVDDAEIKVQFTFDGTNYATIDIMWEDSGITDYKSNGLFGTMNTKYARASTELPGQVRIDDGAIHISIRL